MCLSTRPPNPRDLSVQAFPEFVHQPGDELRVERLGQGREATHVGEEHRDLPSPGPEPSSLVELAAQGGERGVDDLVGHDAPQPLLGGDGRLDVVPISHPLRSVRLPNDAMSWYLHSVASRAGGPPP